MRRRRLLAAAVLGALLPHGSHAQERTRVVGYLLESGGYPRRLSARLAALGYVEGKNLHFETRSYPPSPSAEQLDAAARELAASPAEVLVSSGAPEVLALARATSRTPIVSGGVANPVSLGLAHSLRVPGKNVTGLSFGLEEVALLQFGTLKAFRPTLKRVVFFLPDNDPDPRVLPEHTAAAVKEGLVTEVARVANMEAADRAFAVLRGATDAVFVGLDRPIFDIRRVASSAIRHRIATLGMTRQSIGDGLLFNHGLEHSDPTGRLAVFVDQILRGADPGKIPFELPDKTVFILNRATAEAIGVRTTKEIDLRVTEWI